MAARWSKSPSWIPDRASLPPNCPTSSSVFIAATLRALVPPADSAWGWQSAKLSWTHTTARSKLSISPARGPKCECNCPPNHVKCSFAPPPGNSGGRNPIQVIRPSNETRRDYLSAGERCTLKVQTNRNAAQRLKKCIWQYSRCVQGGEHENFTKTAYLAGMPGPRIDVYLRFRRYAADERWPRNPG